MAWMNTLTNRLLLTDRRQAEKVTKDRAVKGWKVTKDRPLKGWKVIQNND